MFDRRAIAALVVAASLAACSVGLPDGSVTIRTGSKGGACALAAVGGVLIGDTSAGLAFRGPNGNVPVVFPYGYTARRVGGVVFLIDPVGRVVAREGDEVRGAGAFASDRVFLQCGLVVIPQAAPAT